MVKTFLGRLALAGLVALMAAASAVTQDIVPTPDWVSWLGTVSINGKPAPVGTIINAYDPQGVNNGRDTVAYEGIFGFMSVYGDDPNSPSIDEGAHINDLINFRILGLPATVDSGTSVWSGPNVIDTVHLSVTGVTIGLELVDAPTTGVGSPRDTVDFLVGIHNTGNIRDFYGVRVTQTKDPAWQVLIPVAYTYNGPDSVVYLDFHVVVPNWPGEPPTNSLSYTIFSRIDTTQSVTGQVDLNVEVLDAEDPDELLPGAFTLNQNYPNPFNPSTTISFTLPRATEARLEIYNTLGQLVDERDLGALSVGDQAVEYDASELSSGIYFYRVVTEYGAEARKMVLLR